MSGEAETVEYDETGSKASAEDGFPHPLPLYSKHHGDGLTLVLVPIVAPPSPLLADQLNSQIPGHSVRLGLTGSRTGPASGYRPLLPRHSAVNCTYLISQT